MGVADDMDDDENWTGGFYELCLVLGAADDDNLDRAVRSVWRAAGVQGCRVSGVDVAGLADVELGAAALHAYGHLRGVLMLPSGVRVVCGGFVHRYEDVDILELYLPLGALARVERGIGGYPFDDNSGVASLLWRAGLDQWLAGVAAAVYAEAPFERAVIGFEVDEAHDIAVGRRYAAVLLPGPDGLEYRPANA